MPRSGEIDRRSFLIDAAGIAGGFAVAVAIPPEAAATTERTVEAVAEPPWPITAWLAIAPDDTVTIRIARAEMGQGILTGLAMLVAEELDCDWSKVRTDFVTAQENRRRSGLWGDMSTGASRSTASSQLYLRRAGAAARHMLVTAAAARWSVPAKECSARNGIIRHEPSGRSVNFGAVAADAARLDPPADVALKDPKEWRLAGTPQRRLDLLPKVTGEPIYAIDVRLPGMLYAAIRQCPVFRGRLNAVDDAAALKMPGVQRVVRLPDAVAVIADSWWRAKRAVDALTVTWDDAGNDAVSTDTIAATVRAALDASTAQVGGSNGEPHAVLASAERKIEADYAVPFLAHATMEPQTCTAHVRPDAIEVWAPSQDVGTALATAAAAAGVTDDKVIIHGTFLGGGFGRRGTIQDFVRMAVLVAKEVDRPVKLLWSREEDMAHDLYRPFGMARLAAALDRDGMPRALTIRLAGPSFVASLVPSFMTNVVDRSYVSGLTDEFAYAVPNYTVEYVIRGTPVPLGVWRAINYTQNTFYKECFIDELAHAAGIDPYLYRRRLLAKSPRHLAVLDAAAAKAGWMMRPPPGLHRGIAFSEACGSFCAHVVEVSVNDGKLKVHRVVVAFDCGHVVNPLSVEMQLEGAVIFALTAALYGEVTVKNGAAVQSNFVDYPMLKLAETPRIETVLLRGNDFWGGVGEPGLPPLAPALYNAIFAATGKRFRSLPLRNHDLGKAI